MGQTRGHTAYCVSTLQKLISWIKLASPCAVCEPSDISRQQTRPRRKVRLNHKKGKCVVRRPIAKGAEHGGLRAYRSLEELIDIEWVKAQHDPAF